MDTLFALAILSLAPTATLQTPRPRRPDASVEVLAAVDDDGLAGDEGRGWPGEVDDGADDVLRLLVALDRAGGDRDVTQLLDDLRVLFDSLGHGEAGSDAVDAHAVLAELLRERAGEGDDRSLARDVVEQERHAAKGRPRGDVDDRPAASSPHHRHDSAAGQEHRRDVHVHHPAPLLE